MNRSITLSAGAELSKQAHTHKITYTSFSTVWKSPYYYQQHIRNHSASQMFDMNQAACHKSHLDVKQISIFSPLRFCKSSACISWKNFLERVHSPGVMTGIFRSMCFTSRWKQTSRKKKEQYGFQRMSHLILFPDPEVQAQCALSFTASISQRTIVIVFLVKLAESIIWW